MIAAELGQVGTQFDGLGHVGARVGGEDRFYNGLKLSEIGDSYGLKNSVLSRSEPSLLVEFSSISQHTKASSGSQLIILSALKTFTGTLAKQQVDIQAGDVVLFHTGHGQLWMTDNDAYVSGEPGPGVTTLTWLVDKKIVLVGADNWAVKASQEKIHSALLKATNSCSPAMASTFTKTCLWPPWPKTRSMSLSMCLCRFP